MRRNILIIILSIAAYTVLCAGVNIVRMVNECREDEKKIKHLQQKFGITRHPFDYMDEYVDKKLKNKEIVTISEINGMLEMKGILSEKYQTIPAPGIREYDYMLITTLPFVSRGEGGSLLVICNQDDIVQEIHFLPYVD